MPINYLKQIQLGEFNQDGYRIAPSTSVEQVIEGFYVFSRVPGNDEQLVFNDGFPVLAFLQGREQSITVAMESDEMVVNAAWASAGPVKNVYVKYNQETSQIFIVRFYPGAFFRLFNLNAAYFRQHPVSPFESIAGQHQFDIGNFFSCSSISEKVDLVEAYVRGSHKEIDRPQLLQHTLEQIHRKKGNSTVKNVSEQAGVNYKWLERSFLQHVGLLPKEYIQLHRFMHAYQQLVENKEVNLIQIALSNGYYDSNHFSKDFKMYTGKSPIAYLKSEA